MWLVMNRVLMNVSVASCLLSVHLHETYAESAWEDKVFVGGEVKSTSPRDGETLSSGRMNYSYTLAPLSIRKGIMTPPKSFRILTYVGVRNDKGESKFYLSSAPEATVNETFEAISYEGGEKRFPISLPPGRYQLIVTVLVQPDDERPRLVDVHTSQFAVAAKALREGSSGQ